MDNEPQALPDAAGAPRWIAPFCAGFFLLLASFAGFLDAQGYALWHRDVAVSAALLTIPCVVATALYVTVGPLGRRVLETLLVMLVVDLNSVGGWPVMASGVAVFAALTWLGTSMARLLAVFGGITLVAVVAGTLVSDHGWVNEVRDPAAPASTAPRRPAIIHLLLDEHIGLGNFPRNPEGLAAQAQARGFFLKRGFQIHPGAFSRHFHTANAIPDMLNFGSKLADRVELDGMDVGRTRYFERLRGLGYALTIYQSDYGEFCADAAEVRCVTYQSSSLAALDDVPNTLGGRVNVVLAKFLGLADMLRSPLAGYDRLYVEWRAKMWLPAPPNLLKWTNAVAAKRVMDRLPGELEKIRPGQAVFVHTLFPHFPYVTRPDCTLKPSGEWLYRMDARPLAAREAAYYQQLACVRTLIDRQLAALARSPARDNYVFIVHGDHGSRIIERDPLAGEAAVDDAAMRAAYSTLFAVRHSGGIGSVVPGTRPVSRLLEALALTEFKPISVTTGSTQPTVVLSDRARVPQTTRALPADWTAD